MKTMFKSLFVAVLFTGLGTTAFAQLGAQETVTATARILKQITLASDDINFGAVAAGGGATLLAPTGVSSVNIGFSAEPGRLVIDATPEENIRVEFPSWVVMRGTTTANTIDDSITYIPLISAVHGDVQVGDAGQATSALTGTSAILTPFPATNAGTGRGPFAIVTTEAGSEKVTLFLGGNLFLADGNANAQIPSGQETGTYEATLLFNVLYAN